MVPGDQFQCYYAAEQRLTITVRFHRFRALTDTAQFPFFTGFRYDQLSLS
jgi:hypothetical protein